MGATTGGIDWQKYLPELIGVGAQVGGQIYGANKQAGSIDKAAQIGAQTAQQQLNAILGMYGLNRGDRAPHRAVGVSALNTLQNWRPGQQNALAPVNLSQFKPNQVDLPPQLSGMTTNNALSPAAAPQFGDISTKGIQSRVGGIAKGALGGAGLGGTAAGLGNAFLGSPLTKFSMPWLTAAGAGVGAIRGIFKNQNPDRDFASEGINRVSDYTWKTLMPALRAGQISPQEAEQALNQTFSQWQASMQNTPNFNSDVLQKSIASQRAYLQPAFDEINRLKGGQQGVA